MDEQIASVSIGCGLDLSGLTRDLDRINKMTNQVKVTIGVGFDDRQVSTQINKLAQSVSRTVIRPTVDHRPLTELNKHLSDKQRHLKEVDRDFKKTKIGVKFDLRSFGDINKAFDVLDDRVDKATRKLKDLGDTTKKIQSIGSIKVDVTGTVGGRSSSSTSSSSRSGDDRKLAQEIGREVAKNVGKGSIGGTLKSIASIPLKIAGNAAGKVAEGITYGITQEVSKGLGKGLSTAIETTLFKGVGSSELAAEKLGSALAESLMGSFNKQMKGFVKFDENDNPLLPKFLSDNIKNPRQRANLRKFYKELIDTAKAGQQELINTLGGQDTIAEESLAVRGRARSDRRSRRPVAQEQAAYERQQAYRRESDIRSRVPQRLAEVEQDLAEAKEESRQIQEQYKQIEKEVLKAEKFAEEAGKRRAKAQQAYGAGLIDKAELKKAEDLEKKFKDRAAEVSKRITQPILEPKFQQQYQSEFQKYQKDLEAAQKKYQETLNQRNKARENFAKGYLSRDQLKIFEDAETNAQVELTKRSQPFRAPQLEKRLQSQLEDSRSAIAQVRQKRRQGGLSTEEEINLDKLESVSQQRIKEAERNMFSLGERMQQVGSRIGGLTSYRNLLKAAEQQATQAKKEADARFESLLPDTARLPKAYQQLIETVTGKSILDIDPDNVPQIRMGSLRQQADAAYTVQSNTIDVRPDYLKALNEGEMDSKQILVMLHELQHGQDLQFGSFKGMVARRMGKPINPSIATDQERQELTPFVAQYDPSVRELEFNAELVARRNFAKYRQRQKTEEVQSQQYFATQSVSQSKKTIKGLQQSLDDLKNLAGVDPESFGDIQGKIQSYSDVLTKINEQFKSSWSDIVAINPSNVEDIAKYTDSVIRTLAVLGKKLSTAKQFIEPYTAQQYQRLKEDYGDPFTGQIRKRRYPMETDDDRFPAPATESFLNAPDVWNIQDPGSSVQSVSTPPNKPQTFMGKASNFAYNAGRRARQGVDTATGIVRQTGETFDAFGMQAKQAYNIASGVAQLAGQAAEDLYETIAPIAGPLAKAAGNTTKGFIAVTKATYKLAEGVESIVLTVTPYGKGAKGLLQNTVVPMGMLAAAEHYVPGVSQAVNMFGDMATHAITPIAQGYGGEFIGNASEVIRHILPDWWGMQSNAIGALQGGVEGLASGGARMLGEAGATLAAGRMIQTGVEQSFKQIGEAAAPSKPALPPVRQPLNLPSADKEIVLASGEIQKASSQISSQQQQGKKAKKVAIDAAKKAGEVSRSLLDATIATIRSADEAIQEAENLSQKFWDAHKKIKELADKKDISQADIDKAKTWLEQIQATGKNAIADIGYMAKQLGDRRFEESIGSRLSNRQSQISNAQRKAQKLVRKMKPNEVPSDAIDVSSIDAPLERLKEEQIRAMAKDLVVNTAGFAASTALGDQGIVAQLAGDLGGALVARQAVNMGEAGVTAYNQLKDDDLFKAADALKKFTMIVQQASKVMQSADFQEMQGNEIFGDLTGFGIGNAAATLLGGVPGVGDIPMKGAAAAMAIVPQLAKLRDGIRKQLATIEQDVQRAVSSPDAPLERLKFGRQGLNPDDAGDEDQKNFLENILALLDDAIAKANQFDDAFKKVKQTGYQGTNATQEELQNLEKRVKTDPRLKFSYRGVDRKPQNAAEAEFLKHIEDLLVDATIASQRFEQAFKKLDQPSLQKLQESLKSADQAFDEDGKAIVAEVQREIANYEAIVAELDESYRQRSMAAAEKLKEQVEYRRAYAEMMGIDPDSAEGMAGLDIPMPQEEGAIGQFFKALKGDADDLMKSIGGIPGIAKKAIGGLLGFIALNTLLPVLRDFATSSVEAAREFERFERTLGFITGSADKAQSVLAGLRAESKALGIDLRGAIAGQTQLMAATRGTALEGAATEQIGAATRQAASVYGLTPEQFDRMNLAISQMASKGRISAEELRQQLGEVLPNAFGTFAKSIGVTTAQLDGMLMRGEVGTDALVKFAAQLSAETSTGVAGAANSSQAALNRFNTSVYELQVAFGKTLLPAQTLGLEALTKSLEVLQSLLPVISVAISALAGKVLLSLAANSIKAAVGVTSIQGALLNLPKTIGAVTVAAGSMLAAFAPFALQMVVFAAIADSITLLRKRYSDAGGAVRDFANTATDGLQKYLELTGQAVDETTKLANQLKNMPESYAEDSLLQSGTEKLFMGEERGTQYVRSREQYVAQGGFAADYDIANMLGIEPPKVSGEIQPDAAAFVYSEKQGQDMVAASKEGTAATQQLLTHLNATLEKFEQGGGDLRQIRDLDIQARDLQARRSLLPASDAEGRRAIDAEYTEIIQRREELAKGATALQSELNNQIQGLEQANKAIEDALKQGGLSPETQKNLQAELEKNKKLIEDTRKGLEGYAKAINIAIESAARLQTKFEAIVASLDILNTQTQTLAAQDQTAILQRQLSGGLTPGGAQAAQTAAEQQSLARTIGNLNNAIGQLDELLSSPAISRALTMAGLDQNVDALTLNTRLAEMKNEGVDVESEEFKTLQGVQQQLNQRDQLRQQVAQSQQQLVQSQVQASEALRDANKQITEYYRSIQRASEDTRATVEHMQAGTNLKNIQNDFQAALTGFSDSFFGDMWGGINELFEIAQRRIDLVNEASQREREYQRNAQDTVRSGNDLRRSTYSGSGGTGAGLFTGPSANIGGSSDYHIDAKFVRSLGIDKIVELFDQMAKFYADQGRQIEFSNDSVSGQVYRVDDPNRASLLQQAFAAHHSQDRDAANGVYSVDYYVPTIGTDRFSSSVEGAELAIPSISGGRVEYASGGGYGNFASVYDESGNLIMKTGHGDDSRALPSNFAFESSIGAGIAPPSSTATATSSQPTPVAITNLDSLFSGGSNSPIAQIIGLSEGTRTSGGGFTDAYGGHTDPGNAAHNMGSFSYQGGASSPEEADAKWLSQMRGVLPDFIAAAQAAGLDPNDPRLLMNFLDLYTQSPLAATDTGGFLDQLPRIARLGISDASIAEARFNSYINPSTGQLDAPGFGNNPDRLLADQQRRVAAVGQGIPEVFGGPGNITTAGIPSVDTSRIDEGQSQALANANALSQVSQQRLDADLRFEEIKETQTQRRIDRARQQGLRQSRQQNTELERGQLDLALQGFSDLPAAQVVNQLTANTRGLDDTTIQNQQRLLEMSDRIADFEVLIEEASSSPGFLEVLGGAEELEKYKQALAALYPEYEQLKTLVDSETAARSTAQNDILQGYRRQQAEQQRVLDLRTEELQIQQQVQSIRDPELQQLAQFRVQRSNLTRQFENDTRALNEEITRTVQFIDRLQSEGFAVDSTEVVTANEQLETLQQRLGSIEGNYQIELDIMGTEQLRAIEGFQRGQREQIVQGQAQLMTNQYDQFGANQLQRQYAASQERYRYQQEIDSIAALEMQAMGQEGFDASEFDEMRSNAEQLNQINLEGLRQQFVDLGDTLNKTAIDGFGSLVNGIDDVIFNGGKLTDLFDQVSRSIIDSLLQIGTQFLQSQLYSLFFPQQQGAMGGGGLGNLFGGLMGGVQSLSGASLGSSGISAGGGFNLGGATGGGGGFNWGSLLSTGLSLIGGFDKGGLIPGTYTGNPDQHIARVNPGEYVMSRSAVQRIGVGNLDAMNNAVSFGRLPKFNDGGYRDYASSPSRSYRDYNAESEGRSSSNESSGGPIEVKLDTEVVNNIEYARKEEVEEAMKRAAEEGAKKGEERVRRGISKNPSYRQGMGIR